MDMTITYSLKKRTAKNNTKTKHLKFDMDLSLLK